MNRQDFENCNRLANNNLNNKGNLSEFLKSFLIFSQSMGKEQDAYSWITELPPSHAFNNPDPRVDVIISACEQSLVDVKQNTVEMTR